MVFFSIRVNQINSFFTLVSQNYENKLIYILFFFLSPDDGRSDIDNSLVVSMEINGIMYQGVLFAHNPRRMWNIINWTHIWNNLKENNHPDLSNAGSVFWPLTQKGCPQILWSVGAGSRPYQCGCHYQRVSLLSENAILVFKNCANVMLQLIHFKFNLKSIHLFISMWHTYM